MTTPRSTSSPLESRSFLSTYAKQFHEEPTKQNTQSRPPKKNGTQQLQVPEGVEPSLAESESAVMTVRPWNREMEYRANVRVNEPIICVGRGILPGHIRSAAITKADNNKNSGVIICHDCHRRPGVPRKKRRNAPQPSDRDAGLDRSPEPADLDRRTDYIQHPTCQEKENEGSAGIAEKRVLRTQEHDRWSSHCLLCRPRSAVGTVVNAKWSPSPWLHAHEAREGDNDVACSLGSGIDLDSM
ncbi:hypothetical protein E4U16_004356 [Claviceps sp. LM84 group G4]|nr:hypothetical protein E4U16_004356 [Claviceps sp. LM84 group G4]